MKKADYRMKTHNNKRTLFLLPHSLFLFIVLSFLGAALNGQSWIRNYPGLAYGFDAVEAPNGDLIVTSEVHSQIDSVALSRVDSEGNMIWQKRYPSIAWVWGPSIVITADNNYVLAYEDSILVDDEQRLGLVFKKFDDAGDIIWETTHTDPDIEFGSLRSFEETSDNGFLLCGHTMGSASYIMKLNELGEREWMRQYDDYFIMRTIEASNGELLSIGSTNVGGHRDVFLYRLDESGALLWQRSFGYDTHNDYPGSILETNDNGIAFFVLSSVSPGRQNQIIKTDMHGDSLWSAQWPTSNGVVEGSSQLLYQDSDGTYTSLSVQNFPATGSPFTKVDENGNILSLASTPFNTSQFYILTLSFLTVLPVIGVEKL